ncbi:MAG: SAM-dependent methyltransferase [Deltaproteobacteria bacterium]|nr:SAM-dependent methyltransferase [Deltaproteobacteria bacterium]
MTNRNAQRIEYGDWQTPPELARAVAELLSRLAVRPASILEPTCGQGSFLLAAAELFPGIPLHGYEINPGYVEASRRALAERRGEIHEADFFAWPWEKTIRDLPEPILIVGNPPWVTSAGLGVLGSVNAPIKSNFKKHTGLDAITGKGNFDVSEWMILRLLGALAGRRFALAMLCKAAVARRVLEFTASNRIRIRGAVHRIDAMRHFDAAVDAVLLRLDSDGIGLDADAVVWPVFDRLDATSPVSEMGVIGNRLVSDVAAYRRTRHLEGRSRPEWRSGVKHDCARVMEFECRDGAWINGAGEIVDIEDEFVFPLVKGSDLANGKTQARRAVLVTQRYPGDDTSRIARSAPKSANYLMANEAALAARKSAIYAHQPRYAIFGIGDYSFAPFKVAICGLYKRLAFTLVGNVNGKPVMVDDTCYFLPFANENDAVAAREALSSPTAREFLEARIFWDSKRPITKSILQSLDLEELLADLGMVLERRPPSRPKQPSLAFPG